MKTTSPTTHSWTLCAIRAGDGSSFGKIGDERLMPPIDVSEMKALIDAKRSKPLYERWGETQV